MRSNLLSKAFEKDKKMAKKRNIFSEEFYI